jgi:trans-aconitate methyltransferase
MDNFENSWKDKTVFEEQLELNLKELNGDPPSHWETLLDFIGTIQEDMLRRQKQCSIENFLDLGCGCGALAKVIQIDWPTIKYTGMDYAPEAIEIASKQWPFATFIEKNYKDLTPEEINRYDVVNACSLHNVLPNGDEALDFLLSLNPKYLILGKMLTTHDKSHFETYRAYNRITTYKYFHNYEELHKKLFKYGGCIEKRDGVYVYHYLLRSLDV